MSTAPGPHARGNPGQSGGFRRGDHLRASRPGAPHHDGIYLGSHPAARRATTRDGRVRDVTVERRAGGRGYVTRRDGTGFCWSQLLARRHRDGSS